MPQELNVGIDFSQYKADKAKGTISLVKVGDSKARAMLCLQNFHQRTGEELDPTMVPLNPRQLVAAKAGFQAQIDGIDACLADMKEMGLVVEAGLVKAT